MLPPLPIQESSGQLLPSFPSNLPLHHASQPSHVAQPPSGAYSHVQPKVQTHQKGMRDLQLELAVLKVSNGRVTIFVSVSGLDDLSGQPFMSLSSAFAASASTPPQTPMRACQLRDARH